MPKFRAAFSTALNSGYRKGYLSDRGSLPRLRYRILFQEHLGCRSLSLGQWRGGGAPRQAGGCHDCGSREEGGAPWNASPLHLPTARNPTTLTRVALVTHTLLSKDRSVMDIWKIWKTTGWGLPSAPLEALAPLRDLPKLPEASTLKMMIVCYGTGYTVTRRKAEVLTATKYISNWKCRYGYAGFAWHQSITDHQENSRHPWQSWRDRWIRHLKGRPRPALVPANAPPTPPSDHPPPQSDIEMSRRPQQEKSTFSNEDAEALLEIGEDILNIQPEGIEYAWEAWASKHDVCIRAIQEA